MSEIEIGVFYERGDLPAYERGWHFKVQKYIGGGYTIVTRGGPFMDEAKAHLECNWVIHKWETYED